MLDSRSRLLRTALGFAALEATEPELRLTAISRQDGKPVAILNDTLVHEGDTLGAVKVLTIGVASIEVEVHGRRRTLAF